MIGLRWSVSMVVIGVVLLLLANGLPGLAAFRPVVLIALVVSILSVLADLAIDGLRRSGRLPPGIR